MTAFDIEALKVIMTLSRGMMGRGSRCYPAYGARPLKRTIQRSIQDPLALLIPEGKSQEGDTVRVELAATGEGLEIHKL